MVELAVKEVGDYGGWVVGVGRVPALAGGRLWRNTSLRLKFYFLLKNRFVLNFTVEFDCGRSSDYVLLYGMGCERHIDDDLLLLACIYRIEHALVSDMLA